MTPALKETFHDIEGWACDLMLQWARPALHKMNDLLDELHNDLDVLQETMRLILKKAA